MVASHLEPQFIDGLVQHQMEPNALLRSFAERFLSLSRLASVNQARPKRHPYSRRVLFSGPTCEVMLARWAPGVWCLPHNHGRSRGWVFYLQHAFEETSFAWQCGELRATQTSSHAAGTFAKVEPRDVHCCASRLGGVSLHVYFPRIKRMEVYDPAARRTFVVRDDCGAWVPSAEQCLEERKWIKATDAAS